MRDPTCRATAVDESREKLVNEFLVHPCIVINTTNFLGGTDRLIYVFAGDKTYRIGKTGNEYVRRIMKKPEEGDDITWDSVGSITFDSDLGRFAQDMVAFKTFMIQRMKVTTQATRTLANVVTKTTGVNVGTEYTIITPNSRLTYKFISENGKWTLVAPEGENEERETVETSNLQTLFKETGWKMEFDTDVRKYFSEHTGKTFYHADNTISTNTPSLQSTPLGAAVKGFVEQTTGAMKEVFSSPSRHPAPSRHAYAR